MMVAEIRRGIGLNCSTLKVPASTSHSRQYPTYIGTRNYFEKFDFHESWVSESDSFMTSKLGLGTYIGDFSDEHSELFRESIKYALTNGINIIDSGVLIRNEVVISSKAGIIQGDGQIMKRPINYMQEHLIDTGILSEEDVYMEDTLWLTMNPAYFRYALDVSRSLWKNIQLRNNLVI